MAPKGSGVGDYVGMFACTAGLGLEELVHQFKEVRKGGWIKGGGGGRVRPDRLTSPTGG